MLGMLIHLTLYVFLTLPAEPFTVSIRPAKEICIILQLMLQDLSDFIAVENLSLCTCIEIRVFGCKGVYLPVCPVCLRNCSGWQEMLMNILVPTTAHELVVILLKKIRDLLKITQLLVHCFDQHIQRLVWFHSPHQPLHIKL